MSEEIEVKGLSELYDQLETLGPRIARNIIRGGVYAMAKEAAQKIKESAPVLAPGTLNPDHREAGQLKNQIHAVRLRGAPGYVEAGVSIGRRGFYWRFLEYGTVRMGVRAFIRPAWDSVKQNLVDVFAEYCKARFNKVSQK